MLTVPKHATQTYRGFFSYVGNPEDETSAETVAHALSRICRFNGHVDTFWSVGQHSVFIRDRMAEDGYGPLERIWGLLHDGHEAHFQDMNRPLKDYVKAYHNFDPDTITDKIDERIFSEIGVDPMPKTFKPIIKYYDDKTLFTEKNVFFVDADWGWEREPYSYETIAPYLFWSIDQTKHEFLDRLEKDKTEWIQSSKQD